MIRTVIVILGIFLAHALPRANAETPPCKETRPGFGGDYAAPPPKTLKELTFAASVIVDAYVQSTESPGRPFSQTALMLATRVLKGPATVQQFAVRTEPRGYEMKPGQRYILFLAHPEARQPQAQQEMIVQGHRVDLYATVSPAGRFCVDGNKVRVTSHEGRKNPSDGAALEKTLSEIRYLAGPVQLPGRILIDGAPVLPVCAPGIGNDVRCRVLVEEDMFPLAGSLAAAGGAGNDPRNELRLIFKPETSGRFTSDRPPRQATAVVPFRSRLAMNLPDDKADTRMVRISGNGQFFAGLDQAAYRVSVEGLPFGYWVKSIKYGSADLTQEPLNAGAAAVAPFEITLTRTAPPSGGVTLSGRVPQIPPELSNTQMWTALMADEGDLRSGAVKLTSDGAFEFHGVPPGAYTLRTLIGGPVTTLAWNRFAAIPVFVANENVRIEAPLFQGSEVAIRVADSNGKVVTASNAGYYLILTFEPVGPANNKASFGPSGVISARALGPGETSRALLPSGEYKISLNNNAGAKPQLSIKSVTSGTLNLLKDTLKADGKTPLAPIVITLN